MKISSSDFIKNTYLPSLLSEEKKALESYNKGVLFVSSGAILVSINFIDKIIPDRANIVSSEFLAASWCFFVLSIFCNVFSHFLNNYRYSKEISSVYSFILNKSKNPSRAFYKAFAWYFGFVAASRVFLILGMVFLIVFSIVNL